MGVCSVRKFKVVQSYPEDSYQPYDVGHALAITSALRFNGPLVWGDFSGLLHGAGGC